MQNLAAVCHTKSTYVGGPKSLGQALGHRPLG